MLFVLDDRQQFQPFEIDPPMLPTGDKEFSSSLGGGYNFVENKSYQEDLAFNYSYKAMLNLFYKPISNLQGLVIGAEVLYAERFNKNKTSNKAWRAFLLMYYDF